MLGQGGEGGGLEGVMVVVLRHMGTIAWASDRLNMSVKAPDSCSAHVLHTRPGIPSGPVMVEAGIDVIKLVSKGGSGGKRGLSLLFFSL